MKYLPLAFLAVSSCTSNLSLLTEEQNSDDVVCNLPFVELCHPSDPTASQFCAAVCGDEFAYCPEYTWQELEYCLRPGHEYTVDSHACYAAHPTAAHLCHMGSGVPRAPSPSGGADRDDPLGASDRAALDHADPDDADAKMPGAPSAPDVCGDPLSGSCCIRGPWWAKPLGG